MFAANEVTQFMGREPHRGYWFFVAVVGWPVFLEREEGKLAGNWWTIICELN